MTHTLWSSLNQRMFDYLSSVQLAELVEQQRSTKCAEGVEKTPPARRPARRIPVAAVAYRSIDRRVRAGLSRP
jgi:Rrf2 family iron-sulfur cluster assembly transcriptional regulator